MRFFRTAILLSLVWFSFAFINGYVQTVRPMMEFWEDDGFQIFGCPQIAIYTWWDGPNHTWGPRRLMWFQVADFPTGEARIIHTVPSWYGLIPAVGIIVFAAFRFYFFCKRLKGRATRGPAIL